MSFSQPTLGSPDQDLSKEEKRKSWFRVALGPAIRLYDELFGTGIESASLQPSTESQAAPDQLKAPSTLSAETGMTVPFDKELYLELTEELETQVRLFLKSSLARAVNNLTQNYQGDPAYRSQYNNLISRTKTALDGVINSGSISFNPNISEIKGQADSSAHPRLVFDFSKIQDIGADQQLAGRLIAQLNQDLQSFVIPKGNLKLRTSQAPTQPDPGFFQEVHQKSQNWVVNGSSNKSR